MAKKTINRIIKVFDFIALVAGFPAGYYFSVYLSPQLISDPKISPAIALFIKALIFLGGYAFPILIEKSIAFWIRAWLLEESIDKLEKTIEMEDSIKKLKCASRDLLYLANNASTKISSLYSDKIDELTKELLLLDDYSKLGVEITKDSFEQMFLSGVTLVEADVEDYSEKLDLATDLMRECLYMCCIVPPVWFYEDNDSCLPPTEQTPAKKKPFSRRLKKLALKDYQKTASRIPRKSIRVVVLDSEWDVKTLPLASEYYKECARKLQEVDNNAIKHYWTCTDLINNYNKKYQSKHQTNDGVINVADYVIFDKKYFLQYDLRSSLLRVGWHRPALTKNMSLFNRKVLSGKDLLFKSYEDLLAHMNATGIILKR